MTQPAAHPPDLPAALRDQAGHCAALGSPFMARLLTLLAEAWPAHGPVAQACARFRGDPGPKGLSLPLRLAGGLHALVLTGQDADLATVYPPHTVSDSALRHAALVALDRHAGFLTDWMTLPPQTNEVRRSAVLIAAAHLLAGRHDLPFVTSELGASAGLNLGFDRYALTTAAGRLGPDHPAVLLAPDWAGPLPAPARLRVAERAGVDLNPLDPHDPAQALRLLAYLWADQPHRAALTRAAIAAQTDRVDRGDAIDWLGSRLRSPRAGMLHLVCHTIAWQYFPPDAQARGRALIEAAGARATADAPLAWLQFEADHGNDGAAITLRLWPGDLWLNLGRGDFHGRWIRWDIDRLPG